MKSEPAIPIQKNNAHGDGVLNLLTHSQSMQLVKPLRLLNVNGSFIYARPQQILFIESSDHMVVIYLCAADTVKRAIRYISLSEIEKLLPEGMFCRVSRYALVNINRLSGGCNDKMELEFDMCHVITTERPVPFSFLRQFGV
jgi:DNA-binding LytR/AlgR family response regulator